MLEQLSSTSVCDTCGGTHEGVVDLRARFPGYQIAYDDQAMRGRRCPWHDQIVCHDGFICNADAGGVMWCCAKAHLTKNGRFIESKAMRALITLCARDANFDLAQEADDGVAVEFSIENIDLILDILSPIQRNMQ